MYWNDFMNVFLTFNKVLESQTFLDWSALIATLTFAIFCSIDFFKMALFSGEKND